MSQQYSLRWNNHQPNFISMFGNLLATRDLVDVTLAAEGQHLVAHKVVLSACSTYFHSLFVDNPTHHPIVILKDVTFNDLRTIVDFMYYGEVNVTEQQLAQVLETAKILKIKGLTEMPDSTSLTRSQGIPTDFPTTETSNDTQQPSVSPSSPIRRKRQRKSSSGSLANPEDLMQNVEMMRDAVTLSSLNIQKKREMDERTETAQQTEDASSMNIDQLAMDSNAVGMSQEIVEKYGNVSQSPSTSKGRPSLTPKPSRLIERHFADYISSENSRVNVTRRCKVCYSKGIRRESRFWCPDCCVALCMPHCFKQYHTAK